MGTVHFVIRSRLRGLFSGVKCTLALSLSLAILAEYEVLMHVCACVCVRVRVGGGGAGWSNCGLNPSSFNTAMARHSRCKVTLLLFDVLYGCETCS
jgi:hypothetical protein